MFQEDFAANLLGLIRLDLSYNRLSFLSENVLIYITHLQSLDISHNKFTELLPGLFNRSSSIETLDLSYNQLFALQESIFHNLINLKNLDASANYLTSVSVGLFQNLTLLENLKLSFNQLSFFPKGIFSRQSNLLALSVDNNFLTSISETLFISTLALTTLALQYNLLTELTEFYCPNDHIHTVYLHNNNISRVSSKIHLLWPTSAATILSMQNNPSVCVKRIVLIPSLFGFNTSQNATQEVVCECAASYAGVDFCEPTVSVFIDAPASLSAYSSHILISPNIVGGSFTILGADYYAKFVDSSGCVNNPACVNNPGSCSTLFFDCTAVLAPFPVDIVVPLIAPYNSIVLKVPWVITVFSLDTHSLIYDLCTRSNSDITEAHCDNHTLPPRIPVFRPTSISPTLFYARLEIINLTIPMNANTLIPLQLEFHIIVQGDYPNSSLTTIFDVLGTVFLTGSFVLSGRNFQYLLYVVDTFSNESLLLASIK